MFDKITEIVKEAASLMTAADNLEIMEKGGCENIVTSADIAVQDFLRSRLSALLPDSGFICEEGDIADIRHSRVWVIDPIDGTANYARGVDQCAICVGLCDNGVMEMSVVFLPRTGEMFQAQRGKGAWRNGSRIHVSDRSFDTPFYAPPSRSTIKSRRNGARRQYSMCSCNATTYDASARPHPNFAI